VSATEQSAAHIAVIDTPTLGDRSYLVHDGSAALVIDPQRDIDRVLGLAAEHGVRITHVFETHIHNDYLTGGLALARAAGAAYHVNATDAVTFDRVPVSDSDVVYPAYYAHMAPENAAGPGGPDLVPPHAADASELRRRIEAGEWVVDLRARRAFAAGHLAGTLSFDLTGHLATYVGWLIPWQTPLTLLGQTPEQVAGAQRELLRVGIDSPAAMAVGDPAGWSGGHPLRSFGAADFSDLAAAGQRRPPVILDVRCDLEWAESHIDGAIHMPLHELPGHLPELPDKQLWVYCRTGYRASVAASVLDAAGRRVVAVDDDYDRAATAGLPIACR
jgi:hydroxyacylglutathione hydrolase